MVLGYDIELASIKTVSEELRDLICIDSEYCRARNCEIFSQQFAMNPSVQLCLKYTGCNLLRQVRIDMLHMPSCWADTLTYQALFRETRMTALHDEDHQHNNMEAMAEAVRFVDGVWETSQMQVLLASGQ